MALTFQRWVAWYRGLVGNTGCVGKLLLLGLPLLCVCVFCSVLVSPFVPDSAPQSADRRAPATEQAATRVAAEPTGAPAAVLPTVIAGPSESPQPADPPEPSDATATAAPPSEPSPTEIVPAPEGLGITRAEIQSNFEQIEFVFQPGEPVEGQENVVGRSENTLVQLVGPASDLTEAAVIVIVDSTDESQRTRAAVHMIALMGIVQPDWKNSTDWIIENLPKAVEGEKVTQVRGNVQITLSADQSLGMVILQFRGVAEALPEPTVPAQPAGDGIYAVATVNLRVRSGPGTTYPLTGNLSQGTRVKLLGTSSDRTWYQHEIGWSAAEFLQADSDTSSLSVVLVDPPAAASPIEPAPLAPQPTQLPATDIPASPVPPAAANEQCPNGCLEERPGCSIRGNFNSSGERIYHEPGDRDYSKVKMRPDEGDRWFCTGAEAVANGFRHAQQ